MSAELDSDHVAWCAMHFNMLADGGMWAVPRSGLIFQRQGDELRLVELMPWMPEMEGTITPEQLDEQQASDYDGIRDHFRAAGIEVVRS